MPATHSDMANIRRFVRQCQHLRRSRSLCATEQWTRTVADFTSFLTDAAERAASHRDREFSDIATHDRRRDSRDDLKIFARNLHLRDRYRPARACLQQW